MAEGGASAELVRVYEKIRAGIWVFSGVFKLLDAWTESDGSRDIFKFRLELDPEATPVESDAPEPHLDQTRLIPTAVKLEVWKRDRGRCVECGSADNLHFDHVIRIPAEGAHSFRRTFSFSARVTTSKNTTRSCGGSDSGDTEKG